MRKISSYLYPNRIELLADLATFTVEYVNVYQRNVKIYKGIDNAIEFDIKNADQKRIDLTQFDQLQMNVMDASGNALPSSPYELQVTPLRGIATATIPAIDLEKLTDQFLRYSVTATQNSNDVILYADTRFGMAGTLELHTNGMPVTRADRVYDTFTAEIDLKGVPTYHSSAIPAKFYEAVPTTELTFDVTLRGFTGSVWVEATKKGTINPEAFKASPYLANYTFDNFTGVWSSQALAIEDYQYFRVSYTTPYAIGIGASFEVQRENGEYTVAIRAGGTGYAAGSQIKVLGSLLGGVDGINDLIITVENIDASSQGYISSYAVSSISAISWTGVAEIGTATNIVTGTNITGTVDKVVVS